ncbi:cytochrome p450 [Trifolium pratense]|uniref:Cytochrome p450 n=1 Tax=Trifolium pratense TaxID=57577 RepID=A0A2K3KBK1_TRIPR|nr:cytochrome p450 [Trifolium pratense]
MASWSGGGWFRESVVKQVDDGAETFFSTSPWLGGSPLCERFGRLFDSAKNKSCSVTEMYSLVWEVGGGVGVVETIVGVGGGDVGGVSGLTYKFLFSGSVFIFMALAARPRHMLFGVH